MTQIRIGSRGSQLALWQANHIADQLRALGHTVEIEIIRTTARAERGIELETEVEIVGEDAP